MNCCWWKERGAHQLCALYVDTVDSNGSLLKLIHRWRGREVCNNILYRPRNRGTHVNKSSSVVSLTTWSYSTSG